MGSPFSPPTYSGPGFTLGEKEGLLVVAVGVDVDVEEDDDDETGAGLVTVNPTLVARGGAPAVNPTPPEEPGGTIGGTLLP